MGQTVKLAEVLSQNSGWKHINLSDFSISAYDYSHINKSDDFLPLMKEIIENHSTIILVTPVYWYAMSGTLKIFLDRWTDLLTIEKELGRRLRGMSMAVAANSVGENLGDHFWLPFIYTANYLGMEYLHGQHFLENNYTSKDLDSFIQKILPQGVI